MGAPIYTHTGIVLKTTKLRETDLIIVLLTQTGEQISCVAHGARKPGSKFGGRLEPFGTIMVTYSQKGELGSLKEASFVSSRAEISGDLVRLSAASALCNTAYQFSCHQTQDPILYKMLSAALDIVNTASSPQQIGLIVAATLLKIPSALGFLPELDHCVICGEDLLETAWYEPHTGGAICNSCIQTIPGAKKFNRSVLAWARLLIFSTFDEILNFELERGAIEVLLEIAYMWAREYAGVRLKAVEFFVDQRLITDTSCNNS